MKNLPDFFFIVGWGRSGTKLVRNLLNASDQISIIDIETNFLPLWVNESRTQDDLELFSNFLKFFNKNRKLPFFIYLDEKGIELDVKNWHSVCTEFSPAGVFKALHIALSNKSQATVFGDKSPTYTLHIDLIADLFPETKVIHIVRDGRDCCLSAKAAWNSNPYRYAYRWNEACQKARHDAARLGNNYYEIKYENLISDPLHSLNKLCDFLNVEFHTRMLSDFKPAENLGAAKDLAGIKSDNQYKYRSYPNKALINKLERICYASLKDYGYAVSGETKPLHIGKTKLRGYRFLDGINNVKSRIQERGLFRQLYFTWVNFKQNLVSEKMNKL
ncbi:MAG: hypothetical protein ACI8XZ_003955 [Gammaproteobacteria bacterium]|jgi:hypothetical protein